MPKNKTLSVNEQYKIKLKEDSFLVLEERRTSYRGDKEGELLGVKIITDNGRVLWLPSEVVRELFEVVK